MPSDEETQLAIQIGKKIRYAREDTGLSQRELGKMLSVSDKAISSYEVGRTLPNIHILRKLGEAVHRPMAYFDESVSLDVDLQVKIRTIEKELLEIKRLLRENKENKKK
jgi:transcriptional regulator with XRE-family HTH domain